MTQSEFQIYSKAVPIIRAREMLSEITVATFPNLTRENQQKEHKKLFKTAYPDASKRQRPMSLADLAKVLKNG